MAHARHPVPGSLWTYDAAQDVALARTQMALEYDVGAADVLVPRHRHLRDRDRAGSIAIAEGE